MDYQLVIDLALAGIVILGGGLLIENNYLKTKLKQLEEKGENRGTN